MRFVIGARIRILASAIVTIREKLKGFFGDGLHLEASKVVIFSENYLVPLLERKSLQ